MSVASFGAAASQEASNTIQRHGFIVVGIDAQDKPFTEYEDIRYSSKQCLQIGLGVDSDGKHVVAEIQQFGTDIDAAWKAIESVPLSDDVKTDMLTTLRTPEKVVFGGLEFAVGGPAEGKLVDVVKWKDPETQAVLKEAEQNYRNAAFLTVDFTSPKGRGIDAQFNRMP